MLNIFNKLSILEEIVEVKIYYARDIPAKCSGQLRMQLYLARAFQKPEAFKYVIKNYHGCSTIWKKPVLLHASVTNAYYGNSNPAFSTHPLSKGEFFQFNLSFNFH